MNDHDVVDDAPDAGVRYPNVVRAVFDRPWLITRERLETITDILEMRAAGLRFTKDEIQAHVGAARRDRQKAVATGAVAVIPIYGVIMPKATVMSEYSGGTSVEGLQQSLRQAMGDPNVSSILLDIDSPGGSVDLIPEFAAEVAASAKRKPIVAIANTDANSAAYWIASQASELVATTSGVVGSVGVVAAHQDVSAAMERMGVRITYIHAGDHKVDGNPYEPLGEEARAYIQSQIDAYYRMFVQAVAKGRGTTTADVLENYGQGRVLMARDALERGMVDRVETISETLGRMMRGEVTTRARAEAPATAAEAAVAMQELVAAGITAEQIAKAFELPTELITNLVTSGPAAGEPEPDRLPDAPASDSDVSDIPLVVVGLV